MIDKNLKKIYLKEKYLNMEALGRLKDSLLKFILCFFVGLLTISVIIGAILFMANFPYAIFTILIIAVASIIGRLMLEAFDLLK